MVQVVNGGERAVASRLNRTVRRVVLPRSSRWQGLQEADVDSWASLG